MSRLEHLASMRGKTAQRGLSLVLAIFVLVVLALLGAAMINIMGAGSESVAREVISTRALFVAESGVQKKLGEIFPPGAAPVPANCSNSNYVAADVAGISACSNLAIAVQCTTVTADGVDYFTVLSAGSCGPSGAQATRVVEVQAKGI